MPATHWDSSMFTTLLPPSHVVVFSDVPEKDILMEAYVAPKPVCISQHCALPDMQVTHVALGESDSDLRSGPEAGGASTSC